MKILLKILVPIAWAIQENTKLHADLPKAAGYFPVLLFKGVVIDVAVVVKRFSW